MNKLLRNRDLGKRTAGWFAAGALGLLLLGATAAPAHADGRFYFSFGLPVPAPPAVYFDTYGPRGYYSYGPPVVVAPPVWTGGYGRYYGGGHHYHRGYRGHYGGHDHHRGHGGHYRR